MSVKEKLVTAKEKVATFIKEDGKALAIAAASGVAIATLYILTQHQKALQNNTKVLGYHADALVELQDVVNHNARSSKYHNENPWYLEDGDPTKARRVELPDNIVHPNPE